jgi:hypothetical protein
VIRTRRCRIEVTGKSKLYPADISWVRDTKVEGFQFSSKWRQNLLARASRPRYVSGISLHFYAAHRYFP